MDAQRGRGRVGLLCAWAGAAPGPCPSCLCTMYDELKLPSPSASDPTALLPRSPARGSGKGPSCGHGRCLSMQRAGLAVGFGRFVLKACGGRSSLSDTSGDGQQNTRHRLRWDPRPPPGLSVAGIADRSLQSEKLLHSFYLCSC